MFFEVQTLYKIQNSINDKHKILSTLFV